MNSCDSITTCNILRINVIISGQIGILSKILVKHVHSPSTTVHIFIYSTPVLLFRQYLKGMIYLYIEKHSSNVTGYVVLFFKSKNMHDTHTCTAKAIQCGIDVHRWLCRCQ